MYTLKQLRKHLGLSNAAFAEQIGIAAPRISEYIHGKKVMGVQIACKVMLAFNVNASVDLETKNWVFIPSRKSSQTKPDMKAVIKKLNQALKDPELRQVWVANIAMAQIDCERWYREENDKVGKRLNASEKQAIANKGAEHFLDQLSK